jgi:hypothetical protein
MSLSLVFFKSYLKGFLGENRGWQSFLGMKKIRQIPGGKCTELEFYESLSR